MSFVLIFAVPLPPPFRRTKGIGAFFPPRPMFGSIELISHLSRGSHKESIHCG